MQKINITFTKTYKWITFLFIFLIQAGAFLEEEYIAWISGLLFCFFLTVSDEKIKERLKFPYVSVYLLFLSVFIAAAWVDMKLVN